MSTTTSTAAASAAIALHDDDVVKWIEPWTPMQLQQRLAATAAAATTTTTTAAAAVFPLSSLAGNGIFLGNDCTLQHVLRHFAAATDSAVKAAEQQQQHVLLVAEWHDFQCDGARGFGSNRYLNLLQDLASPAATTEQRPRITPVRMSHMEAARCLRLDAMSAAGPCRWIFLDVAALSGQQRYYNYLAPLLAAWVANLRLYYGSSSGSTATTAAAAAAAVGDTEFAELDAQLQAAGDAVRTIVAAGNATADKKQRTADAIQDMLRIKQRLSHLKLQQQQQQREQQYLVVCGNDWNWCVDRTDAAFGTQDVRRAVNDIAVANGWRVTTSAASTDDERLAGSGPMWTLHTTLPCF